MTGTPNHSAPGVVVRSFEEIDPTVVALQQLRELGIPDGDIVVRSSLPYSAEVLGRPHLKSRLPRISLAGALVGLGAGVFFTIITPYLYIIRVGGQPIVPVPPTALLMYEFIMLALIIGTFGGFLVLNHFPADLSRDYDVKLTDERISLAVQAPEEKRARVIEVLETNGGQEISVPEGRVQ